MDPTKQEIVVDQEATLTKVEDEDKDSQYDGGDTIGIKEDPGKCCICIPIDLGVKILGALTILEAIFYLLALIDAIRTGEILLIIFAAAYFAPTILAGIIYLRFFLKPSTETKA
jgi:hypothetical protein